MFHKIYNPVHAARMNFENKYLQREYAGQSETIFIMFTRDAGFRLTGYRDLEKNMYWFSKYPVFVHGESLCEVKVHVRCVMCAAGIIGSNCFSETTK